MNVENHIYYLTVEIDHIYLELFKKNAILLKGKHDRKSASPVGLACTLNHYYVIFFVWLFKVRTVYNLTWIKSVYLPSDSVVLTAPNNIEIAVYDWKFTKS